MTASERAGALAGFALLAGYAAAHWFALVADPTAGRLLATVAIATAAGAGLTALAGLRGRRISAPAGAVALTGAALGCGLLAAGLPAHYLAPAGWGELRAGLDSGLAGISQIELPYEGPAEWTRLGILLLAPVTLTAAAALAFWPSDARAGVRRAAALALLVGLYGVAVTWESPSAELAHGAGLLTCMAAYLWLGWLPARRALPAIAAIGIAGLVALPAAARVSTTDPAVDYAGWRLFGDERTTSFEWEHSYGPLDWPQRGTDLFQVTGASRPMYWKTTVLEDFYGAAWARGDGFVGVAVEGSHDDPLQGVTPPVAAAEPQWIEQVEVSIRDLRSRLLITSGTALDVAGVATAAPAADGTATVAGPELAAGDSYSFTAYVPDPTERTLKARDDGRYPRRLERYTTLLLPQGLDFPGVAPEAAPVSPLVEVMTPLRGNDDSSRAPDPGRLIEGTAYEPVRDLALRLTRGAAGNYEAVTAIERHLLENYRYEQDVPERREPLPAFLFRDRAGYCQQFSGAMALMLRLAGIPSRVVSGFGPGLSQGDGEFLVRDTDAHSWVEVWFPRVGWVTVDPTPSAAPVQTPSLSASAQGGVTLRANRAFQIEEPGRTGPVRGSTSSGPDDGGFTLRGVLALLIVTTLVAMAISYGRRRRLLVSPAGAEPQLRELVRAAPLVWDAGPGATLLRIERELAAAIGPRAARYPAALRENRYARRNPRRPGPRQRRALRRDLGRGRGLGGRLRALRAVPPGGPRKL